MVITSLSDEDGRAVALSRLGFSYGIGMVVGPTLGGLVTKYFGCVALDKRYGIGGVI